MNADGEPPLGACLFVEYAANGTLAGAYGVAVDLTAALHALEQAVIG